MKLYKSVLLGSALIAQSAVVMAGPRLANVTLRSALPGLDNLKLPILGGTRVSDLPLIGGYFLSLEQVGLNQYVATLTHGAAFLKGGSQNLLPLLTGTRGELPGLKATISKLRGEGGRGSGAIIKEVLNPKD